jgi:hypothetical protein
MANLISKKEQPQLVFQRVLSKCPLLHCCRLTIKFPCRSDIAAVGSAAAQQYNAE